MEKEKKEVSCVRCPERWIKTLQSEAVMYSIPPPPPPPLEWPAWEMNHFDKKLKDDATLEATWSLL